MRRTRCRSLLLFGLLAWTSAQARVLSLDGWSVTVPDRCSEVTISRVEEEPGYRPEDVKALEDNPMLQLKSGFHTMPEHVQVDLRSCYPGGDEFNEALLRLFRTPQWLGITDPYRRSSASERQRHQRTLDWIMGENDLAAHDWLDLPIIEAPEVLSCAHQRFFLPEGRGVRALIQWSQFEEFIQSDELTYVFQALLDRTDRYVYLTVPLQLDGLADRDSKTQFGFSWTDIRFDSAPFRRAAAEFLQLHRDQIRPSISELDAMVQSIRWSAAPGLGQ